MRDRKVHAVTAKDRSTTPAPWMTPDEYCTSKAAPSGSSLYYCLRLLPPEPRAAATALHAFHREVTDVVEEVSDPGVARVKLAWWRTEIAAISDDHPHHPVALALVPAVRGGVISTQQLHALIDGMQTDLARMRYPDFAALEAHCERTGGLVGAMAAQIQGYQEPATRDYARDLGIALQLTNIIGGAGNDARRGRIYLPHDELARFGVATSDVLRRRTSETFVALMRFQADRARAWFDRALAELPARDRRAQRAGLAMAAIQRALLDEIARDGYRVLDQRIGLTPLRKLWIARRAAWRA